MATITVDTSATLGAVADGDKVQFVKGGTDCVNGLDLSGLATGLIALLVNRDWTANIGTASVPLKADVDNGAGAYFAYAAGGGTCWYRPNGNSNVCTLLQNISQAGTLVLTGGGTVTTLETGRGRTIIGSDVAATTIRAAGGYVEVQGLAGTAPTTVHVAHPSAVYKTWRGATTINLYEGQLIIDASTNTITTINMYGGRITLLQSGTITNLNIFAGDASNIIVSRDVTVTNTEIYMSVSNADAFLNTRQITFTNAATKRINVSGNY